MIEYIRGRIEELLPTTVVVDCGGIGYDINITLIDFENLNTEDTSKEVKFYIHESIREDAHILYGFLSKDTREYFRLLIGVSGVGPNTARLILSSLTAESLNGIISSNNDAPLKAVRGIGAKTAQRIIIDLKDKIKPLDNAFNMSAPAVGETYQDALAALVMLGFSQQQSQKALAKLFKENPTLSAEQAIKLALKLL